jgi:hypothetical protein
MAPRKKNERRTVLVDKALQARIVLSTSLPMIACLVFATGLDLYYQRQVALGHVDADSTIFGMPGHRLGMLLLFVSASMTLLVSSLLSSQKIAGTSYRIRQVLSEYRSGNRSVRVRLRKGDYQSQLADDLNEFLDWVAPRATLPVPETPRAGVTPTPEPSRTTGVPSQATTPSRSAAKSEASS